MDYSIDNCHLCSTIPITTTYTPIQPSSPYYIMPHIIKLRKASSYKELERFDEEGEVRWK